MSHDRGCPCGREPYEYSTCSCGRDKKTMKKDMTLGEKLQQTITLLEQADIKKLEEQAAADREKIYFQRKLDIQYFDVVKKAIISAIDSGKVPRVKVINYERQEWFRNFYYNAKGRNHDLWVDFVRFFRSEGLEITLVEEHDGMGEQSWIAFTTKVLPKAPRSGYVGDGSHRDRGVSDAKIQS